MSNFWQKIQEKALRQKSTIQNSQEAECLIKEAQDPTKSRIPHKDPVFRKRRWEDMIVENPDVFSEPVESDIGEGKR